nr:hypothetical protein [Tanacetum cinerariifolium]
PVAPTTAEHKLARRNELKSRGTLLMDLPDKHQLKFNSHKDAKTLMEATEKRFGGNTKTKKVQKTLLKQQYKNFIGTTTQNIAFVSSSNTDSTTEPVSAVANVSVVCTKMLVSSLPNVDSLSNVVIYSFFSSQYFSPQLDNEDLKQIDADDLEEVDLKWQMAMLTMRARQKRHFAKECRSLKDSRMNDADGPQRRNVPVESSTSNALVFQCDGVRSYDWSFQAEEEPTNYALMAFSSSSSSSNNEISPTKPNQDLSHTNRPTAPIIEDWFSDSEDESETKAPQIIPSFVQSTKQVKSPRHYVQHVKTSISAATPKPASPKPTSNGKKRNRKACFVCKSVDHLIKDCDYHEKKMAQPTARNHAHRKNHKQYAPMTHQNPQKHMVLTTVLTQSKPVSITVVRPVSVDVPKLKEWKPKCLVLDHVSRNTSASMTLKGYDYSDALGRSKSDKGVIDSGCSRHLTGNMSYLSDFEKLNGGYVAFLELKFNIFSVSQMCDKKNSVLFTDTECLVLSPAFKLPDESQVLLRVPRENNMYNVNLKNIVPSRDLTCLFAKETIDESNLWHKRLGHINFKTMKKLVKGNFVRGLPTKVFENDNTYVACKKGKQQRASYKIKPVSSVDQPLYRLHMDLFGPTFVKSLNKKSYCLVVTDDYSRFTWVFFLVTNDETSPILKTFITGLENQLSLKVKVIQSDNGTEFKNNVLNQFCGMKGIKRKFSNRVLVTKPHNKTPYELLHGRTPSIGFMRPFGCPVTILNTLDSLGKFDRKVDEGFLVGYFVSSKTFRVFNSITRIVQETLHVNFLENKPNVAGSGPTWLFYIDSLTKTINYQPVTVGNQSNPSASFQDNFNAKKAGEEIDQQYVLFPMRSSSFINPQNDVKELSLMKRSMRYRDLSAEFEDYFDNSINEVNATGTLVLTVRQISPNSTNTFSAAGPSNDAASLTHGKSSFIDASQISDDHDMLELEDITYSDDEDDVGAEANFNNLETSITVSLIPTTKVHKDHHVTHIIGDLSSATQTKSMTRVAKDQGHTQEDGIDYKEVFAPVARIEAIRLFLAYASFMGFMVYRMDVKSAFLYGTIEEEVYVCQPLGFEDPNHPNKVYKVVKALYGLHQAPRAWYETLANYLLENGFQRGKIDQTLFIKRQKGDILLVYIYVDDIIFGATNKDILKQKKDVIFISQDKYVAKILRKFRLQEGKSASTPIDTEKPLMKDPDGEDVDVHTYRSMIGSFMHLTSSRPDIMFAANDIIRLQALVDKKKVVVMEDIIQEALHLDDAKGVEPLPNEEIFAELARIGYEKPSTKITFYKAFFSSQVGKGFSGVDTPLFDGMLVEKQVVEEGDVEVHGEEVNASDAAEGDVSAAHAKVPTTDEEPSIPSPTPSTPPPQPSHDILSTSQKVGTTQRVETSDETVMDDVSNQRRMIAEMDQDADVVLEDDKEEDESEPAKVQEVVDVVTTAKINTKVVTAASETITATSTTITTAEAQVLTFTLTAAPVRVIAALSRRRKGVVIRDLQEESTTSIIIPAETKSKDKGKGILVEEPKPLKKQQQIEQDEKYARELEAELNKNIDWDEVIDHVKKKAKEDPTVKKEDLKALWNLVKERFSITKPKNFSDDFLLITLGAMFEKPDIHAQIWKNQRSVHRPAKVKGWKLLESCGVQIITLTTTQLILLVERKYPLTSLGEDCWVIFVINPLYLTTVRFGVDAVKEFKEKYAKCLMLLMKDLVLPSQVDVVD